MKKITLTLCAVLSLTVLFAQSPQAFKYQAVVRDNLGEIIADQEVSFRFSILDSVPAGVVVYQEVQLEFTDSYGHANLEIGKGTVIIGTIADINWGSNDKFLEVELDPEGEFAFVSMGTTQLLAVPYSLYSESTGDTSRWRRNIDDLYYLDGKVGIGTISPQYNLDIYGNATGQSRLRLTNPDNSKILLFGSGNDLYNSSITFQGGDALRFMRYDGGYSELMRIQDDGDIGIGTASPDESALLELNSSTKGFLPTRLTSSEIAEISSPADGLLIYNRDDGRMYVFVESLASWHEINYGTSSLPTTAIFEIGIGTSCNNTVIDGIYEESRPLTILEFVTIEVIVISVGDYMISSDTINGYSFSATGTFLTLGSQTVELMGDGIPGVIQTDNFTATASNGGGTCTFSILVQPLNWYCGDTIVDIRDGKIYNTKLIGTQCWMSENLNIGTRIDASVTMLDNELFEKYCYYNREDSCNVFGGLYQWNEMMDYSTIEGAQGICPNNWHIPTDEEWKQLEGEVDSQYGYPDPEWDPNSWRGFDAGLNLKSSSGWIWGENGLDLYGFNARPGGQYHVSSGFGYWGESSFYWISSEYASNIPFYRKLSYDNDLIFSTGGPSGNGFSVRCIKD